MKLDVTDEVVVSESGDQAGRGTRADKVAAGNPLGKRLRGGSGWHRPNRLMNSIIAATAAAAPSFPIDGLLAQTNGVAECLLFPLRRLTVRSAGGSATGAPGHSRTIPIAASKV